MAFETEKMARHVGEERQKAKQELDAVQLQQ